MKAYQLLIAEDNGINRFALVKMLKELGRPIAEVEDGKQAMDALEEMKQQDTILLLDLNMPVMDGYTVIRKMAQEKQAYEKVKILVISGTMFTDMVLKTGLENHISGYVEKPIEKEDLMQKIRKCTTEF